MKSKFVYEFALSSYYVVLKTRRVCLVDRSNSDSLSHSAKLLSDKLTSNIVICLVARVYWNNLN
jgi:hypothetical protein